MTSPARRRYLSETAKLKGDFNLDTVHANEYELLTLDLANDLARLRSIQSIEKRNEPKREMIIKYLPWVNGVLEKDIQTKDKVLMTVMVWSFDVSDFELALRLSAYALKHNVPMPEQYNRTTPTFILEEISTYFQNNLGNKENRSKLNIHHLMMAIDLTDNFDMPDQVRAKSLKALGLYLAANDSFEDKCAALGYLERAKHLKNDIGVKKDIEVLQRYIAKNQV